MTPFSANRKPALIVEELSRLLPRPGPSRAGRGAAGFGLENLDGHLPRGGLGFGELHEVAPETEGDMPAAFGFVIALLGRLSESGPILLVLSPRGMARCGRPHGSGLNGLGLEPSRVLLVETENEVQALWSTEEALRSGVPAAVVCATGARLDLKTSQRLSLAARSAGVLLVLLRPSAASGQSTAVTRWRVAPAPGARDRFGLIAGLRWRARLARCRNGRTGEWVLEFDHATHRFSLAAALADPALSPRTNAPALQRAG